MLCLGCQRQRISAILASEENARQGRGASERSGAADHIKAIHAETRGAYGWPRIWRELRQRNVRVGKERVRKMMRDNAIRARSKRKYKATTDSNHGFRTIC